MPEAAAAVLVEPEAPQPRPVPQSEAPPNNQGRVAELRVSANLMTLDAGTFCVFPVPGSPAPDPATGLPGVRISQPPKLGRPGTVSISTFRDDGWLDNSAALVRVTEGPAQVLVTIYQHPQQTRDSAPRLQVMRLNGPATAPAPRPAAPPAQAAGGPDPEAVAHVQGTGDVGGQIGDWIGTRGSRLWIEGFGIAPQADIAPTDLEYQAVLGRGWMSPWVEGGKFCGSRGMALPLLGLKLRLKGEAEKNFDCFYSATFVDGTAVGPVPAGETCEAESLAALEAFQIELRPRGGRPTPAPERERKPQSRSTKPRSARRATKRRA